MTLHSSILKERAFDAPRRTSLIDTPYLQEFSNKDKQNLFHSVLRTPLILFPKIFQKNEPPNSDYSSQMQTKSFLIKTSPRNESPRNLAFNPYFPQKPPLDLSLSKIIQNSSPNKKPLLLHSTSMVQTGNFNLINSQLFGNEVQIPLRIPHLSHSMKEAAVNANKIFIHKKIKQAQLSPYPPQLLFDQKLRKMVQKSSGILNIYLKKMNFSRESKDFFNFSDNRVDSDSTFHRLETPIRTKKKNINLNIKSQKKNDIFPTVFKKAIYDLRGKVNLEIIRKDEELIGKNDKEITDRILNVMGLNVFRGGMVGGGKVKRIGEVFNGEREEKIEFLVSFLMNQTMNLEKTKENKHKDGLSQSKIQNRSNFSEKYDNKNTGGENKRGKFQDCSQKKEEKIVKFGEIKAILKIICKKMTEGKEVFEKILENMQLEREDISKLDLIKIFETDYLFFLEDFMRLILCEFA